MDKKELLIGFVIGLIDCVLGVFLFISIFTDYGFMDGIETMKAEGKLGKLVTLGAILDLINFGIFLKMNKEMMARGVILAVICIAIFTIFA